MEGIIESLPRTPAEYRAWWAENTDVAYGYCWCGCGQQTKLVEETERKRLRFKDQPFRFIADHRPFKGDANSPRTNDEYRNWWKNQRPDIPYGFCWCGCEQKTNVVTKTTKGLLHFAGEPMRYLSGHKAMLWTPAYREEDRGYETPCWVWQRSISPEGYGVSTSGSGWGPKAHRIYYQRKFGPVPSGLELDHLCRVRTCVNPEHLEAL